MSVLREEEEKTRGKRGKVDDLSRLEGERRRERSRKGERRRNVGNEGKRKEFGERRIPLL